LSPIALLFIVILVIIIAVLVVFNIQISKKIETFKSLNERVNGLNVLQQFMDTLSEGTSINEKLESINDIIIGKYNIKYSTIVVFDGADYVVKASNVERKHWDALRSLQSEPEFKYSIEHAIPKYVTVENENEKLNYQKTEFGRAKCAIFFPLYVDNVYIGYWVIEGSRPHEFDKMDSTILEVVRNNIVTILKTVQNQATIENTVRDDKYSGLKSAEYLYGEGKKTIDQFITSAICIFKIVNLPDINTDISRKTGDMVITKVAETMKVNLGKDYVFVRYMGPKFAIVFSGADTGGVQTFMNTMKGQLEQLAVPAAQDYYDKINPNGDQKNLPQITVSPKIKVAIATYYKGTQLDGAFKKLEQYIDSNDKADIAVL
jgi:GGDEF domain-containing protein